MKFKNTTSKAKAVQIKGGHKVVPGNGETTIEADLIIGGDKYLDRLEAAGFKIEGRPAVNEDKPAKKAAKKKPAKKPAKKAATKGGDGNDTPTPLVE